MGRDDLSSLFDDMRTEAIRKSAPENPLKGKTKKERRQVRREAVKASKPSGRRRTVTDTDGLMDCSADDCNSNLSGKCRCTELVEEYRRAVGADTVAVCMFYNDGSGDMEVID